MKAKITIMCAAILSLTAAPILLASNVEFQRKVQTQTTLIQQQVAERQRKMEQKHAEYLDRKKQMQKRSR